MAGKPSLPQRKKTDCFSLLCGGLILLSSVSISRYVHAGETAKDKYSTTLTGTLGLNTRFDNGTTLKGFFTATDEYDFDLFGNSTNLYGGIRLSLPIGNIPFVPDGSEVRFATGPFARDSGQTLSHPLPLYDVTEPIAYRQLSRSWKDLLN